MLQPFDYDPEVKNKHKFMVQTILAPDGPIESQEQLVSHIIFSNQRPLNWYIETCSLTQTCFKESLHIFACYNFELITFPLKNNFKIIQSLRRHVLKFNDKEWKLCGGCFKGT